MRRPALSLLAAAMIAAPPAIAMVGGAQVISDTASRPEVMFVGSHGNFCTGVAIAADLVLTSAHCMRAGSQYKRAEWDANRQPVFRDIRTVARHPQFNPNVHRAGPDVALIKLADRLAVAPAQLASTRPRIAPGERFTVFGYGVAANGDGATAATLRSATLTVTGRPGSLQIRLVDPAGRGERAGLGACAGDSGGPVYQDVGGRLEVVGVVSWSTGPALADGCGGLTGVTPIELYRKWIVEQAARMGSALSGH
jgi:secreted trypsin-like serine protease